MTATVLFRLLGPFEVEIDGEPLRLGGPKPRTLLAYLAANEGTALSLPAIVDAVWGEDPPEGSIRSLRTHVSNLRRLLGDSVEIRAEAGTYRLDFGAAGTDVQRFEVALDDARAHDDPQERAARFGDALAMWRGPVLADVDRPWVLDTAAPLDAERRRAVAAWAEATLEAGDADTVIPVLEGAIDDTPYDELLTGLLMRALYATGRHTEALAVYRELRNHLASEIGVEPGPELRSLEEQILLHDTSLRAPGMDQAFTAYAGRLIGRDADVEDLRARLATVRLLSIIGPGGVGKTRLVLELGRRLVDAGEQVFFVDLSTVPDGVAIEPVLAAGVGVQAHPDVGPLGSLVAYLRPRRVVLAVDNCEHLAGPLARALATLLRGCPQLRIVATSRAPLHIDGELEWRTAPLALPARETVPVAELVRWPGVELLLSRAPTTFQVAEANAADVVELCRRLDGLPLALELAAARLGSMTPAEITAALDADTFETEDGGTTTGGSLAATVAWSYGLLSAEARSLFDRLGVMAGEFGLDDVIAVCAFASAPERVRARLAELVDQSLVMADTTGRHTRFRLLETIRRFSLTRLDEAQEDEVRRRHAHHYAEIAERHAAGLLGPDEADAVRELRAAYPNLRSAVVWARAAGAVDIVVRIVAAIPDWAYWRSWYELARWAEWAWDRTGPDDPRWRAVCGAAARGAWIEGRFDDACRFAEAAGHATGGPSSVVARSGHPGDAIADVRLYRGEPKAALAHYERVVEQAHQRGDQDRLMWATYYVSVLNAVLQRPEKAGTAAAAALRHAREIANPTALSFCLYATGLAVKHRQPDVAAAMFEEAVRAADTVRNTWFGGIARMELAATNAAHGDPAEGFRALGEVIDHWYRVGDETQLRIALRYLARGLLEAGLVEEAAIIVGALLAKADVTLTHPPAQMSAELIDRLGDPDYVRLTTRGAVMSLAELVVLALGAARRAAG